MGRMVQVAIQSIPELGGALLCKIIHKFDKVMHSCSAANHRALFSVYGSFKAGPHKHLQRCGQVLHQYLDAPSNRNVVTIRHAALPTAEAMTPCVFYKRKCQYKDLAMGPAAHQVMRQLGVRCSAALGPLRSQSDPARQSQAGA